MLSLAIGIGADTTIFTIANALLFRPPAGIEDHERLVDILSHEFWTRRFNKDASIIGTTLQLSGRAFTVTGVAPVGGEFPKSWPEGVSDGSLSGFTQQLSYTWSRGLGEFDSDGGRITGDFSLFRLIDPRNRRENKTLINHRTHDIRSNGTWQLPFGPQQKLLGNSSGILARIVERWQLGAIFSWNSGAPLTLLSGRSTITGATTMTPDIVGSFPKSAGGVTKVANGVTYFADLTQVADPGRANVTTLQSTQGF